MKNVEQVYDENVEFPVYAKCEFGSNVSRMEEYFLWKNSTSYAHIFTVENGVIRESKTRFGTSALEYYKNVNFIDIDDQEVDHFLIKLIKSITW